MEYFIRTTGKGTITVIVEARHFRDASGKQTLRNCPKRGGQRHEGMSWDEPRVVCIQGGVASLGSQHVLFSSSDLISPACCLHCLFSLGTIYFLYLLRNRVRFLSCLQLSCLSGNFIRLATWLLPQKTDSACSKLTFL